MELFLGRWNRTLFPAYDTGIQLDPLVKATIKQMLRTEGPALPLPKPFTPEYYRQILRTLEHMSTHYPLKVDAQGVDRSGAPHDAIQHQNLRAWAYLQACNDATDLLAHWFQYVGAELSLDTENPEQAIILVRALQAARLAIMAQGENRAYLSAVVQECVIILEQFGDREPMGQVAESARTADVREWADSPWQQVILWMSSRLPITDSEQ